MLAIVTGGLLTGTIITGLIYSRTFAFISQSIYLAVIWVAWIRIKRIKG